MVPLRGMCFAPTHDQPVVVLAMTSSAAWIDAARFSAAARSSTSVLVDAVEASWVSVDAEQPVVAAPADVARFCCVDACDGHGDRRRAF